MSAIDRLSQLSEHGESAPQDDDRTTADAMVLELDSARSRLTGRRSEPSPSPSAPTINPVLPDYFHNGRSLRVQIRAQARCRNAVRMSARRS
jgi:hypothetical protein